MNFRSKMSEEVTVEVGNDEPATLIGKWRAHYNSKRGNKRHKRAAKITMRCLMAVQAPMQLFMMHYYIIPYLFEEYDDWTRYYLKVAMTFLCVEGLANFLCTILYDTSIPRTRDRPYLPNLTNRWDNPPDQFVSLLTVNQNGSAVNIPSNDDEKSGFEWRYCEICQMNTPPRAHHCDTCEACILKRDHHCFMVGNCIGFRNQRYFVVLSFYAVLCGFVGGYLKYRYLMGVYYPVCYSWTDFIPPVAGYRWMFGTVEGLSLHINLMITQLYLEFLFGFFGFIYFTSQITIISQGITLYELAKFVPIRSLNSVNTNFRSVFGDFWALNFLFPMQLIFRQREDGIVWEGIKMDHNANLQEKTN